MLVCLCITIYITLSIHLKRIQVSAMITSISSYLSNHISLFSLTYLPLHLTTSKNGIAHRVKICTYSCNVRMFKKRKTKNPMDINQWSQRCLITMITHAVVIKANVKSRGRHIDQKQHSRELTCEQRDIYIYICKKINK